MAYRVRGDLRQATVDASGAALLAARLCTNTVTTSPARDRACTTHKQAAPAGGALSSSLASGDELRGDRSYQVCVRRPGCKPPAAAPLQGGLQTCTDCICTAEPAPS